jgi:hypothetical protein
MVTASGKLYCLELAHNVFIQQAVDFMPQQIVWWLPPVKNSLPFIVDVDANQWHHGCGSKATYAFLGCENPASKVFITMLADFALRRKRNVRVQPHRGCFFCWHLRCCRRCESFALTKSCKLCRILLEQSFKKPIHGNILSNFCPRHACCRQPSQSTACLRLASEMKLVYWILECGQLSAACYLPVSTE